MVYFDCAATVKPYDEALKVFDKITMEYYGNPSSNHGLGFLANGILEKARSQVAKYLNVHTDEVIFTSGASEGNNLAIKGVAYHNRGWANRLITTKAEHPSVTNVFQELEKEGFEVIYLDYDKDGNLDLEQLKKSLNQHTSLVSVMAVNNEVGYRFPIHEIHEMLQDSKAVFHVDATQCIGKEELNSADYDLMTFSGHKIGGLRGSGVLIKKKGIEVDRQILGGSQEMGYRAGTSATALDCALASALRMSLQTKDARKEKTRKLNDYLRKELSGIDEVEILSPENASPFILSFALREHKGSVIAEALSNDGVYVSTKSACSSKEAGYSDVIHNAGFDDVIASNALRLSFSGTEEIAQAEEFIRILKKELHDIKERN